MESATAAATATADAGAPPGSTEATRQDGIIREGLAEVLPVAASRSDGAAEVFYNPAQVMNRDLSVLVLAAFGALRVQEAAEKSKSKPKTKTLEGMRVLEALAATGIRSIRYNLELGKRGPAGVKHIVANDLDAAALEHMRRNLQHNGVSEEEVEPHCGDANAHMHSCHAGGPGGRPSLAYDVVDIDPYGTSSPFLDAAVQAVVDGGLLCVTSTDMPVLAGNYPEACFARYGGTALKSGYVHEMSLRLLLNGIAMSASRYGRQVEPLISCSIDFYIRVFVRIHDSPAQVKHLASRSALVHQCVQCETFALQPMGEATPSGGGAKFKPARVVVPGQSCPECGGRLRLGGPCYAGPLHSQSFVQSCLKICEDEPSLPGLTMWRKIAGLLTAVSEELPDVPLYYKLPALCKGLKLPPIPLKQFRATLGALGYRASHFHREPEAVKTDAPNAVVYDLMRLWAEEQATPEKKRNDLLAEITKREVALPRPFQWTTDDGQAKSRLPRFLPNPTRHWGPKPRAKGMEKAPDAAAAEPEADDGQAKSRKEAKATGPLDYRLKSRATYTGSWQGEHRHGQGVQVWPDGAKYDGQWEFDKATGHGRFEHIDGDVYEGQWLDDKAHGQGTYTHADGSEYQGEWAEDKQHGKGIQTRPDGSRSEGYYKCGKQTGHTLFKWADGSSYEGEFFESEMHGEGLFRWVDGRTYQGQWAQNRMHGRGLFTWPDGRTYDGEYVEDTKEGRGDYKWPDGRCHSGQWKNGKQHGLGTYTFANGERRQGEWEDGKRTRWL